MVLAGAGLSSSWEVASRIAQVTPDQISPVLLSLIRTSSRKIVILVSLFSLIGGLTVIYNLGYQKTHRPDVVAQNIQANSRGTALVAIAHQTHGQTGRLMGVALELHHSTTTRMLPSQEPVEPDAPAFSPYFLLAHQTQNAESAALALREAITQMPKPLDLWLINFQDVPEQTLTTVLEQQNCQDKTKNLYTDGYRYRLYRCNSLELPRTTSRAAKQKPKQSQSP
jgi:hypothetical protein